MKEKSDIAIVGMSCIFPGAGDVETFWNNIAQKVDAIGPVPESRMEALFFDKKGGGPDRFYCSRGGFIDDFVSFDAASYGLLPVAVEGMEPEQLLALKMAHRALSDAGVWEKDLSLDTAGVIIGKGNYTGPGATRAIEIIRTGQQLVELLKELAPDADPELVERVKKEYQLKKGRFAADTAMGLIPNLVASLVSNRFDMGGCAYTVDAACASSLVAVDHAVRELRGGGADLMLAGGVHAGQNAPFWSIFSQLGAMSRGEVLRAFDRRADGLLIGEGCGFVVLRRLEDAIRDGHRIYAVIKGVGVCSDGAGVSVMSPSVKGQAKAIRKAWADAGLGEDAWGGMAAAAGSLSRAAVDAAGVGVAEAGSGAVEGAASRTEGFDDAGGGKGDAAVHPRLAFIEAHGTGTPLGDKIELETLESVFGRGPQLYKIGIGTVKSNIGHAMPAAGIAGLIKSALALYHRRIPPTLHCEEPLMVLEGSRFVPVKELSIWEEGPMRAGVNAFGFGGINAHVVLESYGDAGVAAALDKPSVLNRGIALDGGLVLDGGCVLDRPLVLARESKEELEAALAAGGDWTELPVGLGKWRIVVFDPSAERLEKALKIVRRGNAWRNRQDIWFTNEPLISGGGKIAFLFPGLDGLGGEEMGNVTDAALRLTERSHALDAALKELGVRPDHNAGHSVGEWLAGRSAGWVSEETVKHLLQQIGKQSFDLEEAGFLMVGCGYDQVAPMMADIPDLFLSNDNCPQQVILCGTNSALDRLVVRLKEEQVFHQMLPFRSGFHSPFLKDRLGGMMEQLRRVKFQRAAIPLWSATSLDVYPSDESAIHALSIRHLLEPVRFRQLTRRLLEEGVRVFIQVGSGGLIGFVDDTLKNERYSAVAARVPSREGALQLQRVLAALYVEGAVVKMEFLRGEGSREHRSAGGAGVAGLGHGIAEGVAGEAGIGVGLGIAGGNVGVGVAGVGPETAAAGGGMGKTAAVRKVEGAGKLLQMGSPMIKRLESLKALMKRGETKVDVGVRALAAAALAGVNSGESSIERAFLNNMAAMAESQSEIMTLLGKRQTGSGAGPELRHRAAFRWPLDISLRSHPYLIDHALVRQREGWMDPSDMDPVIPMTMMLELLGEIAEAQAPGITVKLMKNIRILQWMNVAAPFRETVQGQWIGEEEMSLTLEKYASAEMVLGDFAKAVESFLLPIGAPLSLREAGLSGVERLTTELIYEKHMFHGPAYQGIRRVVAMGEEGITGIIEGSTGYGSLLDNAGQLFGLWLQFVLDKDRIAFPVKIREIEFYEDRHAQEGRFECTCRLTSLNDGFATADFVLKKEGRVWAVVRGWQNRRLEIDQQFWRVAMAPLQHFLSEEIDAGVFFFHNAYSRLVSWELVFKRYFDARTRGEFASMSPARKKEWTIGRIAGKDAVRALLLRLKKEAYYPIELDIVNDGQGRPLVRGNGARGVSVSLAHKGTDSVAIARYGSPVGIDIERIEHRDEDFVKGAFCPEELALWAETWQERADGEETAQVRVGGATEGGEDEENAVDGREGGEEGDGEGTGEGHPNDEVRSGWIFAAGQEDMDEWITRLWVAKEAYGKYIGVGLKGNPKNWRVEEVKDDLLRIKEVVIKTIKYQNYIIGWTL